MTEEALPDYVKKRVLVLGVGNILFGDDGFGPAAADYIQKNCKIPDDTYVMDIGISAGDILFNIALSQQKPQKIIILDAVDMKKKPGTLFSLSIDELPASRLADFSTHFFPATALLKTLRDEMSVDIIILACQAKRVPDIVSPGLSEVVTDALPKAAEMALKLAKGLGEETS